MDRLVREFRPDVVHAHKLYPQLSVAPVVVAARHQFRWSRRCTTSSWSPPACSTFAAGVSTGTRPSSASDFSTRRPSRCAVGRMRRVSVFVAVSRFVARVHARHGIVAEVLPNFVPVRDGHGRSFDDRDGVVFWGRLRPEKGVDDVIEMANCSPAIRS